MSDLISIVLPVYNGEEYLEDSLNSVINQTYKNWELLILDDCSKDSTPEIAKKYVELDKRIKYFRNENNLKLPGNLNKGFSLAQGDYLTWTSDDNMFKEDALERMLTALKVNDVDLVYASYQIINEKSEKQHIIYADSKSKEHILGSNVVGACFMYTRKAYELVGDYDTNLFLVEDHDYWQRMIAVVNSISISDVLYYYRWHENSLTSTKRQEQYGKVLEEMINKNRPKYGKLSVEQKYYYYLGLNKAFQALGKKPQALKESIYKNLTKVLNKLDS